MGCCSVTLLVYGCSVPRCAFSAVASLVMLDKDMSSCTGESANLFASEKHKDAPDCDFATCDVHAGC